MYTIVLNQECRGLNWIVAAKSFDNPSLVIRSEAEYQLLVRIFVRISGTAMPAAGLLGTEWVNKTAQLTILTLAANSPRNIVDFSAMITQEQLIPGENIPTPSNLSWLCLPLYQRFIELANSGLSLEVLEILSKAAASFPEYFLISLSQIQDPTSGIRSELLRRLLPLFTGLQGSRPTSMTVMRKLHAVNPELLVILCRIAFKKAKKVWEINTIDSLLRSVNVQFARRIEEEGSVDELLSYWCVKNDRSEMDLATKIAAVLETDAKNAPLVLGFLKNQSEALHPRGSTTEQSNILSLENFVILLQKIQTYQASYPMIIPQEELKLLVDHYNTTTQRLRQQVQQGQQSHLGPQPPVVSTSTAPVNSDLSATIGSDQQAIDASLQGQVPELTRRAVPSGPEAEQIDHLANTYFQKIYTEELNMAEVVILLRQFKGSSEKREQEIFRCMIHNLFDEYRFFQKYPEKELQVTGRLFGALVQHQLVSSITLGIALRYVLEALRKDPEQSEGNDKMFRFGKISFDQFQPRLGEWPQYCSHLIQVILVILTTFIPTHTHSSTHLSTQLSPLPRLPTVTDPTPAAPVSGPVSRDTESVEQPAPSYRPAAAHPSTTSSTFTAGSSPS